VSDLSDLHGPPAEEVLVGPETGLTEEVLPGGNMNAVVRIGDTVHRDAGPWTTTVHRLLDHLRGRGVPGLPEPLGMDGAGREVLTFLPGTVPVYPMPAWVWTDEILTDAARLLRTWHEASIGFDETDAVWQSPRHEPVEVIGHNDFSPHNMVFADGRLVGVIDVDMCSPGSRVWDLSYLATRLVPLTAGGPDGSADVEELRRRIALLIDAYGPFEGDLLRTAHIRLIDLADFSDAKAVELNKPHLRDEAAYYRAEADWLQATLLDAP
jgi:hypothetical protein